MTITHFLFGAGDTDRGAAPASAAGSKQRASSSRQERLRREYVRRGRKGFVVVKSPEAAEGPSRVKSKTV